MTKELTAARPWRAIVDNMTRIRRRANRWSIGMGGVAVAALLAGCFDAGGVTLSTLNQSDHAVILQVVADQTKTFVLPAHSYTGLYSGRAPLASNWHVRVFDESCQPVVDQQMTIPSGVLYIAADGTVSWKRGTEGATGFTEIATPSATACPS